ncbi:MAG: tetratricopeptide repeat protein [Chthoniobacterales bacterium]
MKPAQAVVRSSQKNPGIALLLGSVLFLHIAQASSSDFILDESQRMPEQSGLGSKAEREAEAMARFVTGIFEEESLGPERAMQSFRRVLEIDPGFTRLAIDVAHDYLRRGASTEAIGVLKDALKQSPKDTEIALALSSIYLRHLRKPDLASKYAEQAITADPRAIGGYEALWEIALAEGNAANVNKALDRALRSKSESAEFWIKLAELYTTSTSGDAFSDEAYSAKITTCLSRAIAHAGEDVVLLARIGDFYTVNRQYEPATALYQQVLSLKPNMANINERLAETLIQLGRYDEALPVLEAIIAANPLDIRAYDQIARIHTERDAFEQATAAIEQAIIIDKSNPYRYQQLASLLLYSGDADRAADRLSEARRIFPQVPLFTQLHAKALSMSGAHDASMTMFERAQLEASVAQPELLDGAFYFDYGMAAEAAGRYVKAADLFRKSIELDPYNAALALNALGYMWADRNENLDEAEALIRRALELEPDNGAIIDSLGWVLYRKGDFESALHELLRAANQIQGPDAVVYDHIGDAYHALERESEALLYWQKSLQLDADNTSVVEKVDRATSRQAKSRPDAKGASFE